MVLSKMVLSKVILRKESSHPLPANKLKILGEIAALLHRVAGSIVNS